MPANSLWGKSPKLIYHKYANAFHAKKHPEPVDRSQQNGNLTVEQPLGNYEIDTCCTCLRMSVTQFQIPQYAQRDGEPSRQLSELCYSYAILSSSPSTACVSLMRARRALRATSSPFGSIPSAFNWIWARIVSLSFLCS